MGTPFTDVYDRFFTKITDDMYLELTPRDTVRDLRQLLIDAIPGFEFPRKVLDYTISYELVPYETPILDLDESPVMMNPHYLNTAISGEVINIDELDEETLKANAVAETSSFNCDLTSEEINILALLMMCGWVQRQVTSIEITRQKYSGADFKFTSQSAHLSKLLALLSECQRQAFHMQRLYKRRYTDDEGKVHSNWVIFGRNYHDTRI